MPWDNPRKHTMVRSLISTTEECIVVKWGFTDVEWDGCSEDRNLFKESDSEEERDDQHLRNGLKTSLIILLLSISLYTWHLGDLDPILVTNLTTVVPYQLYNYTSWSRMKFSYLQGRNFTVVGQILFLFFFWFKNSIYFVKFNLSNYM